MFSSSFRMATASLFFSSSNKRTLQSSMIRICYNEIGLQKNATTWADEPISFLSIFSLTSSIWSANSRLPWSVNQANTFFSSLMSPVRGRVKKKKICRKTKTKCLHNEFFVYLCRSEDLDCGRKLTLGKFWFHIAWRIQLPQWWRGGYRVHQLRRQSPPIGRGLNRTSGLPHTAHL